MIRRMHWTVTPLAWRALVLALLSFSTIECRVADSRVVTNSLFDPSSQAKETPAESAAKLAAADPLAFLKHCLDNYDRTVSDYRCIFLKRERMNDRVGEEQEMAVLFREKPFSVDMRWIRNPGGATHVNYVEGRWNENGKEMAHIVPSGVLALLAPNGVKRGIHAPDVLAASRRSIDQFGFRSTLELIIKYSEMAQGQPGYEMHPRGIETFDGRSCYVFERKLPYTEPDEPYPDRTLMIYIDREWLVPLACLAYADDARKEMLGSYVTRSIEFNVGLTDADFDPHAPPSGAVTQAGSAR